MITFLFINMPKLSDFFNGGIISGIKKLLEFIVDFFQTSADGLRQFYETLQEINKYVQMWTTSFAGGETELPVFASVGAYRYLVGEGAFYLTYIAILCGCLFTIFRLVYIIYQLFEKLQDKINSKNKKTASGLIDILSKFFT